MTNLKDALDAEIKYIKDNKPKKPMTVHSGILLSVSVEDDLPIGYYQFPNTSFINLTPDTAVKITIQGNRYGGYVQFCDRNVIEFTIEEYDYPSIDVMQIEADTTRLLELLKDHIVNYKPSKLVDMLQKEHRSPGDLASSIPLGQDKAIAKSLNEPISIIWGPPGTGKTYTLAEIAVRLMEKGKSVLIVSQSNMAVDTAVLQVKKVLVGRNISSYEGRVVRYGMTRSEELMKNNPELLSWDLSFIRKPDLKTKYERLSEEIKAAQKNKIDLVNLIKERNKITKEIAEEERRILFGAKIIATTATKATINSEFASRKWDAVIFDEISMAYVPQIIVAATLAKEKLILLGDFKQLSPIVKSPDNPLLKKDIFSYLNVTDECGNVRKHRWLSMLNVQWRMHPDIASFVNERYYKQLTTAPSIIEDRKRIASLEPFSDKVFSFVDYAGIQAVSMRSSSFSRFNMFSAILSLNLAIEADDGGASVGIITPYAAQSSLINSMLLDLEKVEMRRRSIYCSTVHQFQGSEQDVIIFDTVENTKGNAGKMLAQSDDDESMRLINVALTRAKGKFIIVGNIKYMLTHEDLSDDVLALVKKAKETNHVQVGSIKRNYLSSFQLAKFYSDEKTASESFIQSCLRARNLFEYWHIARNTFDTQVFTLGKLADLLNVMKECPKKKIYAGDIASKKIPSSLQKRLVVITSSPSDDFAIVDSSLWMNVPAVTNTSDGTRPFYSITGRETVALFEKLEDLERRRKPEVIEDINNGEFAAFLNEWNYRCNDFTCAGTPRIKISSSGGFYLVCSKCKQTIQRYIDREVYDDYLSVKKIRCQECGGTVKISKKSGRPYCTTDFKHKVGFDLKDVVMKPSDNFKKKK